MELDSAINRMERLSINDNYNDAKNENRPHPICKDA